MTVRIGSGPPHPDCYTMPIKANMPPMFEPGRQSRGIPARGKEFRGVVVLTEAHTSGNKVRVRSGDFILSVDEKQRDTTPRAM
jgi:hypothetical protein